MKRLNILATTLVMVLGLAACSAFNSGGDYAASNVKGSCADTLMQDFAKTYQPFLVNNCASCHASGGVGKGAFADGNLVRAFEEFQLRGYQLIADRAISASHQPPFTGPQLQPETEALEVQWQVALTSSSSCSDLEPDIPLPDDEPIPNSATYTSGPKDIGDASQSKTLTWNLASEIALPEGTTRPGAQFSIDIQTETSPTGVKSYILNNPTLSAGSDSLRIAYVEVFLNEEFMGNASTFRGIDRYVPANGQRLLSQTSMVVPFEFANTDALQIAFGILDPTAFNPTTFTELTSNVFTQSCNGCHSGGNPSGGLDLTDYNGMLSQYIIIPYSTTGSSIYSRMNDESNPMPPSGLLPQATRDSVRDWIRDGAPE